MSLTNLKCKHVMSLEPHLHGRTALRPLHGTAAQHRYGSPQRHLRLLTAKWATSHSSAHPSATVASSLDTRLRPSSISDASRAACFSPSLFSADPTQPRWHGPHTRLRARARTGPEAAASRHHLSLRSRFAPVRVATTRRRLAPPRSRHYRRAKGRACVLNCHPRSSLVSFS